MCGICAGIGKDQVPVVLAGMKKLEYRGYDSSGIAYLDGKIKCVKSVGQIKNLEKKIKDLHASVVIGHTRWATHGIVSEQNAHPHLSQDGNFAIVHNGIIENFEELKTHDMILKSQTDTEVFVNLISKQKGSTLEKVISASKMVKGSFAVAIIHSGENKIFLAKRSSPLMVAVGHNGVLAASDLSVFANNFEFCFVMNDGEFAVASKNKVEFFDSRGKKIAKQKQKVPVFDSVEEELQEQFFMQKEIKEQPMCFRNTYFKWKTNQIDLNFDEISKYKNFHFVACGTAYHSSCLGAKYLQQFCGKHCEVSIASEFRYASQSFSKKCLFVFVSQSGETADTIACAKLVKQHGCKILCVTNVPYCSLNALADFVLPTFAGREVAVASTKAYTCQVFTLLLFALRLAGKDEEQILQNFVQSFCPLQLSDKTFREIEKFDKVFFIGRQQDYVTSLEGALKLKEIAYVGCMGLAAGELKHGTLALIDKNTLVIAIATQKNLKDKMQSNILEVRSRGGTVLLISQFCEQMQADIKIELPDYAEFLQPIVSVTLLQNFAFSTALNLGYDPDKPRNLAKSVTVE